MNYPAYVYLLSIYSISFLLLWALRRHIEVYIENETNGYLNGRALSWAMISLPLINTIVIVRFLLLFILSFFIHEKEEDDDYNDEGEEELSEPLEEYENETRVPLERLRS